MKKFLFSSDWNFSYKYFSIYSVFSLKFLNQIFCSRCFWLENINPLILKSASRNYCPYRRYFWWFELWMISQNIWGGFVGNVCINISPSNMLPIMLQAERFHQVFRLVLAAVSIYGLTELLCLFSTLWLTHLHSELRKQAWQFWKYFLTKAFFGKNLEKKC